MKVFKFISLFSIFLFFSFYLLFGQEPVTLNTLNKIPLSKVLNDSSGTSSFTGISNKMIILDFFGTWCAPCIKALPHLLDIQQKFKDDVKIFLVSNETEAHLASFIKAKPGFAFPVIVDVNNSLNDLFQPPSLPFTVVINKTGTVFVVNEMEGVTENGVKSWISGTQNMPVNTSAVKIKTNTPNMGFIQHSNKVVQLSQDYIYKSKTSGSTTIVSNQIKDIAFAELLSSLNTDNYKKAFWINLYNGYTQEALKKDPGKYKNRNAFFSAKNINVSGHTLSLDLVEHGILRNSKIKWSLGYLHKIFPSKIEKQLRVDTLDYRIHFALNCGAKSCPPIAFYDPGKLDDQLDVATRSYLSTEVIYNSTSNIVLLPALMGWFRNDFGGKKGMIRILKKYNIIPGNVKPGIRFKKYDWTLSLNNYLK